MTKKFEKPTVQEKAGLGLAGLGVFLLCVERRLQKKELKEKIIHEIRKETAGWTDEDVARYGELNAYNARRKYAHEHGMSPEDVYMKQCSGELPASLYCGYAKKQHIFKTLAKDINEL